MPAAGTRKGPVELALERARRSLDLSVSDAPTLELARVLARAVDAGVLKSAATLLPTLVQLGMTPKARAGVIKPAESDPLDELRKRRAERLA